MSQGNVIHSQRFQERDFAIATPEEFVRRFQGTKAINKVCACKNIHCFDDFHQKYNKNMNSNRPKVLLLKNILCHSFYGIAKL